MLRMEYLTASRKMPIYGFGDGATGPDEMKLWLDGS